MRNSVYGWGRVLADSDFFFLHYFACREVLNIVQCL